MEQRNMSMEEYLDKAKKRKEKSSVNAGDDLKKCKNHQNATIYRNVLQR